MYWSKLLCVAGSFNLTAEIAETAELISAKARNKDIFLSVLVFLAEPAYYFF
jgi:hypothetical protein